MGKSLTRAIIVVFCVVASSLPALSQRWVSPNGQPLFSIMEIPEFGPRDIRAELPRRPDDWRKYKLKVYKDQTFYVDQKGFFFKVYPYFPIDARQKYSKSGKGLAIPITMRIDSRRIRPEQWRTGAGDVKRGRRITLDKVYPLPGRVHAPWNRPVAVKMAKEVLEKTVCYGGTVTEDRSEGAVAKSYNGDTRSHEGFKILEGWVIKFRCSRWREN